MWESVVVFRRRRGCFGKIVLIAVCILLYYFDSPIKQSVQHLFQYGIIERPTPALSVQGKFSTQRILHNNTFKPILSRIKKENNTDAIHNSPIYTSKKTSFEEAFPPNSSTALTLNAGFAIGNFGICRSIERIDYIVLVHSAVRNFGRRQSIRSTWARRNLIQGVSSRTVFLTGQIEDQGALTELLRESESYGDIVQGQFLDTYDNLTLKNVMGLRWVSNYCSNAKFVIKVDDDVFVDIYEASKLFFPILLHSPRQVICKVSSNRLIFRSAYAKDNPNIKKWVVKDDYFKGLANYPMPFCHGFAVLMSVEMVLELYQAAQVTPAFPLDDVYVTGILASTVKNSSWRNERVRFVIPEQATVSEWGCVRGKSLVIGTFRSPARAQRLWKTTLSCHLT